MSEACCAACDREEKAAAAGQCSISPRSLKPPTQFYFETSAVEPWGTSGLDDLGAMWVRHLRPCDHIIGISASVVDSSGDPVVTTASIEIFMSRRREQINRQAKTTANWASMLRETGRSFRGGVLYASTSPRSIYATNFGRGWDVGGDWAEPGGRKSAPVPVIMYRKATAAGSTFQCLIEYQACNKT